MTGTWDDHEVEDNYAGALPGGAAIDAASPSPSAGPRAGRPTRSTCRSSAHEPAGRATTLYRRMRLGTNVELFLLDQRQYRDDQPCNDSFTSVCTPAEQDKPGRTLLGAAQKRWLKDGLSASRASWKLVGNPLMMMALDVASHEPLNKDSWDGYGAERAEVLDHIRDKAVRNVSFLTGDIHTYFAGELHRDGRSQGASIATEFVGGSISSRGVVETLQGAAKGAPIPPAVIFAVVNNVETVNPHIKFHDSVAHGYAVAEAGASTLKVDFVAVEGFTKYSAAPRTLASFIVEDGVPKVVRTK